MKMILNVDFLPGVDIKTAITEASQLARELDLAYVRFKFNGTDVSVGQRGDALKGADEYIKGVNHIIVN